MSLAKQFLSLTGAKGKVVRTSFDLSESVYKQFKELCILKNVTASDLLDFVMADFIKAYSDELDKQSEKRT